MRTGPLGRREAHISRFIEGFTTGFQRPAFIDPLGRERIFNHRARPARLRSSTRNSLSDSPPLNLKCALPINLREFLAGQFAAPFAEEFRIDEDGVFTLGPGAGEDALSRVARAIRRYSTNRAHERWDECARPTHVRRPGAAEPRPFFEHHDVARDTAEDFAAEFTGKFTARFTDRPLRRPVAPMGCGRRFRAVVWRPGLLPAGTAGFDSGKATTPSRVMRRGPFHHHHQPARLPNRLRPSTPSSCRAATRGTYRDPGQPAPHVGVVRQGRAFVTGCTATSP